jgi:hypothetical protein
MNIHFHIERLILDGLPITRRQGPLVQAAVEAELARLFAINELTPNLMAGGVVSSLHAGGVQLAHDGTPKQLGVQIAGAVYNGLGATKA